MCILSIGMTKSKMIDLKNIWRDKDLSFELKLTIMTVLLWTTITYGAEGWTLKSEEKKKIQAAEMWCHRRLLNVTYKDRKTNESVLEDLGTERELFGQVVKKKTNLFWTTEQKKQPKFDQDLVQGKQEGKRGKCRPRMAYMDNVRQ